MTSTEEVAFLKKILPKHARSVTFCHNDIHAFNILSLNKDKKLVLIDFEYADYNYRAYDIVNLFTEATIVYDTPEYPFYELDEQKFPARQELYDFVKHYLFFYKFRMTDDKAKSFMEDEDKLTKYLTEKYNVEDFIEEVEEIMQEVNACRLFTHYYWILWAIIMSKGGNGSLEHLHYAHKRYEVYQGLKAKHFSREAGENSVQEI